MASVLRPFTAEWCTSMMHPSVQGRVTWQVLGASSSPALAVIGTSVVICHIRSLGKQHEALEDCHVSVLSAFVLPVILELLVHHITVLVDIPEDAGL